MKGEIASTLCKPQAAAQWLRSPDEINQILGNEVKTQEMLKELQYDLSVSKRAYTSLDSELSVLRELSKTLERERDDLLNKLKVRRPETSFHELS